MNFAGIDAISRPTRAAARTLSGVALSTIVANWLSLDLNNFNVFGVQISADELQSVATIFLMFLMVGFLVHWYGDYVSYRAWHELLKQRQAESRFGGQNDLLPRLSLILNSIEDLLEKNELDEGSRAELKRINSNIGDLKSGISKHKNYALFYIYIWHLAVPIALAAYALCLNNNA